MSYDLEVYCVERPLSTEGARGTGWQVLVMPPLNVEHEDVPAPAHDALPGIQYVVHIHVEGQAPQRAFRIAGVIARDIARKHRGVIVDQQQGSINTPRGVKRYEVQEPHPQDEHGLYFSWFFVDDKSFEARGVSLFIDLLSNRAPEAMPRRYGLFEPPQFRLDREGIEHFRSFLGENLRDLVVWYCSEPFEDVEVSIPDYVGPTRRGFRCCRVTVSASPCLQRMAGWPLGMMRLWLDVATILRPFYAEIRAGADHGTSSWWWNGIPPQMPLSVLVGTPYLGLWPEFVAQSEVLTPGLQYIDAGFAPNRQRVRKIPRLPVNIAQPPDRRVEIDPNTGQVLFEIKLNDIQYPPAWPFAGPRVSE